MSSAPIAELSPLKRIYSPLLLVLPIHPEWMRWRENEITVRLLDERRIAIHGPKGALGMLRKNLSRREGFAVLPR